MSGQSGRLRIRQRYGCDALMRGFHESVQTSTGKPPPVAFLVGELSSLPSQMPVTRLAV